MASKVTAVAFDDDERETLRGINNAKRISALVKPLTDEVRNLSKDIAGIAREPWVSTEDLESAARAVNSLRGRVENMPDTEEKGEILLELEAVSGIIDGARSLG